MSSDCRFEHGPFDIIGDVHGCIDELVSLLDKLGYGVMFKGKGDRRHVKTRTPPGRRVLFVGDLVDRGPGSPDVMRIVMTMVARGQAFCVPGNHDVKFARWQEGRDVKVTHGLGETVRQMMRETAEFRLAAADFIRGLDAHLWLDGGALVIAHAGISEDLIGIANNTERHFCLYGDTAGERDEYGLPVRYNWAADYSGEPAIVYGHTPIPEPAWLNNTLCIDTGCVFGGTLTALRWPERELVQVAALKEYATKVRPFGHPPERPRDRPSGRPEK